MKLSDLIYSVKNFIHWHLNPYYWIKPRYVSFVEEGVMNPDYEGYIGGRVEVWSQWYWYDIDEYRFLTKDIEGFYKIRDKYDFANLSFRQLHRLKELISKYCERVV